MHTLRSLAWGRIALGAASLAAPHALTRLLGGRATAETTYLTRVYGARALALGTTYLRATPAQQRTWHRIGLAIDTSDTVAGLLAVRGGAPARPAAGVLLITGGYAALGARQLLARHT